jgi:hypothetical protein
LRPLLLPLEELLPEDLLPEDLLLEDLAGLLPVVLLPLEPDELELLLTPLSRDWLPLVRLLSALPLLLLPESFDERAGVPVRAGLLCGL